MLGGEGKLYSVADICKALDCVTGYNFSRVAASTTKLPGQDGENVEARVIVDQWLAKRFPELLSVLKDARSDELRACLAGIGYVPANADEAHTNDPGGDQAGHDKVPGDADDKDAGPETSRIDDLREIFGRDSVSRMTTYCALTHIRDRTRASSFDTIFDELLKARLIGEKKRDSLVTNLNRMKTDKKLIEWADDNRGQDISLTDGGKAHIEKLRDRLLREQELEHLRKVAPHLMQGMPTGGKAAQ